MSGRPPCQRRGVRSSGAREAGLSVADDSRSPECVKPNRPEPPTGGALCPGRTGPKMESRDRGTTRIFDPRYQIAITKGPSMSREPKIEILCGKPAAPNDGPSTLDVLIRILPPAAE